MNFELFIAKRITFFSQKTISKLVISIALVSIALGVAVMEVSISIVRGFQKEINEKVVGFGAHIQIKQYGESFNSEIKPLGDTTFFKNIRTLPEVKSINRVIVGYGLVRSKNGLEGAMLKGVDNSFDWDFFKKVLVKGRLPRFPKDKSVGKEILISKKLSQKLNVNLNDKLRFFFLHDPPRARPGVVVGIYETNLEEFDDKIILCDAKILQKIHGWPQKYVSSYEVNLKSIERINENAAEINNKIPVDLEAKSIIQLYPEIFDWVNMQFESVRFILIMMMIIAIINMSSAILIMIIEESSFIGILKALGASRGKIQRVFLWKSFFLIVTGVFFGNLFSFLLLGSQDFFHWFKLDAEQYMINAVPVSWEWLWFLGINGGIIAVCTISMLLPTMIIRKISPIKAIRGE